MEGDPDKFAQMRRDAAKKGVFGAVAVVAAILVLMLFPKLIGVYTDYLWFLSVDYQDVFTRILFWKIGLIVVATLVFLVFFIVNLIIASKRAKKTHTDMGNAVKTAVFVAIIISIVVGFRFRNSWMTVLQYMNQVNFSIVDPLFGKDIAFYVFSMPLLLTLFSFFLAAVVITFIALLIMYFISGHISAKGITGMGKMDDLQQFDMPQFGVDNKAKQHLAVLGLLFFLVLGFRYYLGRYMVLFSSRGIIFGAGYTDVHVDLPVLSFLAFVCVLIGIFIFLWPMVLKKKNILVGLFVVFIGVAFIGQVVIPGIIQSLIVSPNEVKLETPYIENNLEFTRKAYGLDKIEELDFDPQTNLTKKVLDRNQQTMKNIRLWDEGPLKQTYKQLQEMRLYYEFMEGDIDRYHLNGDYVQVMLSPRELSQPQLPSNAKTWVNLHLVYTHGYGLALSPVRVFTKEGLPDFYIKDIPPKSDHPEFKIDQPEIYYGEEANDFIITNTGLEEFDYPKGDKNIYTKYQGNGGIYVDGFFRKLLMALRFSDIKILLSQYLTLGSKIHFNREVRQRITTIAPFLFYDSDPYMVIAEGRLFWIVDAYTISDKYPYSDPIDRKVNYIRNSVKVVVDAYNGDVHYFIIDHDDPIIKTYERIFPKLFRDFQDMPSSLKKHIRYPYDLFVIQVKQYEDYHMKDPVVFYNKEDKWDTPKEIYGQGQQIRMRPYYIIMKLPHEAEEEFILLTPFTPHKKDNMIAWLAARSDKEYGKLLLYKFPKERLIYGPMQIEARIDQHSEISQQLTLWAQKGSNVIRGNLIVIPIDDSLLYVEPLYIIAERGELPELKRVIMSYESKIVMEKDISTALEKLFGKAPIVEEPGKETEGIIQGTIDISELADNALIYYESIEASMRDGDWSGIGSNLDKLKEVVEEIKERSD